MMEQLDLKDKEIEKNEVMIKYLKTKLEKHTKEKDDENKKTKKQQMQLSKQFSANDPQKQGQDIVKEFFIRLANFLFKKKLTLNKVIHSKIYDKVLNGVEVELINCDHFWRLIEKVGFKTIKSERKAVNEIVSNNIFEVKSLRTILAKLGIEEDMPPGTKNFNYEDLPGNGIRIINKIIRYMKENKLSDITEFLGKENIETKCVVAGTKSENVEILSAEAFLKVCRDKDILKKWEDLDDNLQTFLGISAYA